MSAARGHPNWHVDGRLICTCGRRLCVHCCVVSVSTSCLDGVLFCARYTAILSVLRPSYLTSFSTVANGSQRLRKQRCMCLCNNLDCRAAAFQGNNAINERMIVQTPKPVIIVPQATISKRARGATRLHRDSSWLNHVQSTWKKAVHVQTQRMHCAKKSNSGVGSDIESEYKIKGQKGVGLPINCTTIPGSMGQGPTRLYVPAHDFRQPLDDLVDEFSYACNLPGRALPPTCRPTSASSKILARLPHYSCAFVVVQPKAVAINDWV